MKPFLQCSDVILDSVTFPPKLQVVSEKADIMPELDKRAIIVPIVEKVC